MKIFISQPMKDLSEEEIRYNREKAIKKSKISMVMMLKLLIVLSMEKVLHYGTLENLLNYYQLPMWLTF